jgi:hypothetical protein
MNKPPAKTADIDPRAIAADFFRKLGGMEGMTKWGKTHRSLAYQLIAKLMAQPLVQTNNVNVAIADRDGESARRKLEEFMMRQVDARGLETGAVYVNDEQVNPHYIEHQPLAADARPPLREAFSDTPQPATADISNQRMEHRREAEAADRQREAADPAPQPTVAAPVNIATGEPSTTAKYLEWSNNSSSQWWPNLPGRVK